MEWTGCGTYNKEVVGLVPGRVAFMWFTTWISDCLQTGESHLGIKLTVKVNSAFHPSGVGKSSIGLPGWC